MTTGHAAGLAAEKTAELYLRAKGYQLLQRRYRTPHGEIDLVMQRGRVIVFFEVKYRKNADIAAESIHMRNQMRVRQAAELYLQRHPAYDGFDIRFDALLMAPRRWPQHIENAF